jgi:3-methyladenine DNA glycosylase Tag
MGYKEFHHPRQEVNRVARMETKMMRKMLAVKRLIRNR